MLNNTVVSVSYSGGIVSEQIYFNIHEHLKLQAFWGPSYHHTPKGTKGFNVIVPPLTESPVMRMDMYKIILFIVYMDTHT